MEENRVKALAKRKAKNNPPFHTTKMNPSSARVVVPPSLSRSMTEEERRRTEENRTIALARLARREAKSNAHGHGIRQNSSLTSVVVSLPLRSLNHKNSKCTTW